MNQLDPATALQRCGNVCDGGTLRQLCDPWQLRVAVRDGQVVRLGRNSYALPGADEALAAATRLHGVASHLSAAVAWGWKVKRVPTEPVVALPRGRKLGAERRSGIDVRFADVPREVGSSHASHPEDYQFVHAPPVQPPDTTADWSN